MVDDQHAVLSARLQAFASSSGPDAATVRQVLDLVAAGRPWDRSTPMHVTASALILHPPTRRVLLRWHERQAAWMQVGGHGDPGERDPLEVALREGEEETGLRDLVAWPEPALQHVVIVPVPANEHEPAHHHADLRFFLATSHPDRASPERPTAPLRWLDVPSAVETTSEDNVRETIRRAGLLLASRPAALT
jgi:8-oxo-dGTP pyrophosphatase MutT (NUDIX family)